MRSAVPSLRPSIVVLSDRKEIVRALEAGDHLREPVRPKTHAAIVDKRATEEDPLSNGKTQSGGSDMAHGTDERAEGEAPAELSAGLRA